MKEKIINKINGIKEEFNIIPKKKISIPDIKQYLVEEFNNTNKLQKEVYKLQDDLRKCAETEVKYQATLLTLDEYKQRLIEKDKRIEKLNNDIKTLEQSLKNEKEKKNTKILEYKKLETMYRKLNSNIEKETAKKAKQLLKEKINIIQELKGNISKKSVIDILNK